MLKKYKKTELFPVDYVNLASWNHVASTLVSVSTIHKKGCYEVSIRKSKVAMETFAQMDRSILSNGDEKSSLADIYMLSFLGKLEKKMK